MKKQLKNLTSKLSETLDLVEILSQQLDAALTDTCEENPPRKVSGPDSLEGIFRGPACNKLIYFSSPQEPNDEVET